MTTRKNYNSIVFITTLSVYLGLVLVGAPVPVLAQAALTGRIEVKDKIEKKDDLDKKPSDEELKELSNSINSYFSEVKTFIEDLRKLHGIEKFDESYDEFNVEIQHFVPCSDLGNGSVIFSSEISEVINERWLKPAITDAVYRAESWASMSDCLPNRVSKTGKAANSRVKISYDKSKLNFEISAFKSSPQKSEQLAENFNRAFKIYEVDEDETIVKQIYENTSFKSENNQVFIVTRLPRGSLGASCQRRAIGGEQ